MNNLITIKLSYDARLMLSRGAAPPNNYRLNLHNAVPAHVCEHVLEHGITEVTVTSADITTHGSVKSAAIEVLSAAVPEPIDAYRELVIAVYIYEIRPTEHNRAKAHRAQRELSRVLGERGYNEHERKMVTERAVIAGCHEADRRRQEDAEDAQLFAKCTAT